MDDPELTPEELRRAEEIFQVVSELPPADREAFINRECGKKTKLAEEVRQLLAHFQAAPADFLRSPALDQNHLATPETIGPYELKEVLGEGGMGVVYRAEQRRPVKRSVALKILKLGMNSEEILTRFEAERQSLAQLEHPNIARVYDAGTTADGRPFFVMEYVQGLAITTYCDSHRLNCRQRIELFIKLCRGVQYAHQKGIIHRDLKPMNILVVEHDGIAQPKVIDFGVAKALQQELTEATAFTQHGQLIGTPEYMSPEQAEAAPVDTRSDVYSLGAVLYELLVGVLPIDAVTLRQAGYSAMMKLIREQDPQRPSTRISTISPSSATAAQFRNVNPRILVRSLRGELDWIALKALEKNPERRYETVAALAADLDHHLKNEPVTARPASPVYILKKFALRHRAGAGFAITIALALIVLAVTMTIQTNVITRERDRANHEAIISGQVKNFLLDLFEISDPGVARGNTISAREVLDRGTERINDIDDAGVRAELTETLGAVYQNLGLNATADSLFQVANGIWLREMGPDDPRTLMSTTDLASICKTRGFLAEAESLYTVVIEGWQKLQLGDDPRSLIAMGKLANVYRRQGHYAIAESLYSHSLQSLRLVLGNDDSEVLSIQSNEAFCYSVQNQYDQAAVIYEDALPRLRRVEGNNFPATIMAMGQLGAVYSRQNRFIEAEKLLTEALERATVVLGTEHPNYITCLESLSSLYFDREDYSKAVPIYRNVLAARRRINGDEHPGTIVAIFNLAAILSELGELQEAEVLALEALDLRLQFRGEQHPYTLHTRYLLALLMVQRGAEDEALDQLTIAVNNGFAHSILLDDEVLEILSPLQGRPEFESILATVRLRLEDE